MVSRVWIINGILAVAIVACWMNIWDVWQTDTAMFSAAMSGENGKPPKPVKAPLENVLLADADYQSVVDRNLFSPNRTAPSPETGDAAKTEPVEDEARISGEKVMLYGVVLFGGYKTALINNPGDQPKGVQNKWVKEGDSIGNLKVREIRQDQVVLADSQTTYRVLLYDPEKVRKASASPKTSTASQPKVVSVGDATQASGKTAVKSVPPNPKKSNEFEKRSISEDGQYEIIDTPLGIIKRKRK